MDALPSLVKAMDLIGKILLALLCCLKPMGSVRGKGVRDVKDLWCSCCFNEWPCRNLDLEMQKCLF